MALNNDFSKYLAKKLSGLSSNKINKTGSLTFGSLTSVNKYLSVFSDSTNNIAKIDYDKIVEALNAGSLDSITDNKTKSAASVFNELLAIDEINKKADISGDGEIDAIELQAFVKEIAKADGNDETITIDDINAVLNEMGIDLDSVAETAIKEAVENLEEEEKAKEAEEAEEAKKAKEAEEAKEAAAAQQANNSSNNNVGGSSSGGSAAGIKQGKGAATTKEATPEEIQKQIDDKNNEISKVESEAEAEIAKEQNAKEEDMKAAGITEKQYEEYQKKDKEFDTNIKQKESDISKKEDEISDYNSTISSNKNYLAALETQIKDNETRKSSITGDDAATKQNEIDAKTSKLKSEKQKIETENSNLEKKVKDAEKEKEKLEKEKEKLETDKTNLLKDTLDNAKISEAVQKKILEHDTNIQKIKSEKDNQVNSLKNDVQNLQVELKDAKVREERKSFIKENKAVSGLGLTGEELVEYAKKMLNTYGETHNLCATGVSRTFAMAYGLNFSGNGCDWDSNMDTLVAQGAFEEVTGDYATAADLAHAPAGAVVCWEASGNGTPGGTYGHVTIADGNGGEISDHYSANIYTSIGGRSDLYRVFIPVT